MDVVQDENQWAHMSGNKYATITWKMCKTALYVLPPGRRWKMLRTSPGGYENSEINSHGVIQSEKIFIRPTGKSTTTLWPLHKRVKHVLDDNDIVYQGAFQLHLVGTNYTKVWTKAQRRSVYKKLHKHFHASTRASHANGVQPTLSVLTSRMR